MTEYVNVVVVGDEGSKKTNLLQEYTGMNYTKHLITSRYQNNVQEIIVDHQRYLVNFIDTDSRDGFELLRKYIYEKADCILLCYSICDKKSFMNIAKKWCLEVRKTVPSIPLILVGTELDKRQTDTPEEYVTYVDGENMKLLIGARAFIECSIVKFIRIDDIFIEAIRNIRKRY